MGKVVDYHFTVASPYTFLGSGRLAGIIERAGATLVCRPVSFVKIFPATGGQPLPKRAPERRAYRLVELRRWRDHLGIPINVEPRFFPVDDALATRMVTAAREEGREAFALSVALGRAVWIEERDVADRETLLAIAGECGHDGEALVSAAEGEAIGAVYARETDEAIARGVFGAPTYAYGDELFWGQDRLDFLERALLGDGG